MCNILVCVCAHVYDLGHMQEGTLIIPRYAVYVSVCVCFSVHIVVSEDLVVHAGRDGGLKTMEVQGILKLRISDPDYGFIRVQVSAMT